MAQYIGKMSLIAALLLPVYVAARVWVVRRKHTPINKLREAVLGVFVVSMAALGALALQPYPGHTYWPADMVHTAAQRLATGSGLNFVPFETVRLFAAHFTWDAFLLNVVGNVVMFIPIGLFLPWLYQKWQRAWKIALVGLAVPIGIESVQFFIGRSTDIDDVMMNFIGVMLGWGLFLLAKRLVPGWARIQV